MLVGEMLKNKNKRSEIQPTLSRLKCIKKTQGAVSNNWKMAVVTMWFH